MKVAQCVYGMIERKPLSIGEELEKAKAQIITRTEKRKRTKAKNLIINEKYRRRWLVTQGKSQYVGFDDE